MSIWEQQKWSEPTITQTFGPERTSLTLSLKANSIKSDGKKVTVKTAAQKQVVIEFLTNKVSATSQEIADVLNVGKPGEKSALFRPVSVVIFNEDMRLSGAANTK